MFILPLPSFYPNAVAPNDEKEAFLLPSSARRYCGMSKKVFIIVLVVGVVLVVVGVVGGVIGGVLNSQKSKSSKDVATSSTSCIGSQ